ncbi:MAG: FecCD family ABC transporter permease [Tepidisphaerales bacterium]
MNSEQGGLVNGPGNPYPNVVRRFGPTQLLVLLAGGLVLWLAVAGLSLCVGSNGLLGWPNATTRGIRLDSVKLASLIGAALAAAGVVCQTVLRNPLADPYLLGVSSGATLLAFVWRSTAVATMLGPAGFALGQQGFAFVGGIGAAGAVFIIAGRRGRLEPITLLLTGVIVNAVAASCYLLLNALWRDRPGAGDPITLLVGSINTTVLRADWYLVVAVVLVGCALLQALAGQLNAMVLSEAEAQSLGIGVQQLRWLVLGIASLVTASAVALSGPIGFVGLICPHLARGIVGPDVRRLLPVSIAAGAIVLCIADAAARMLAGLHSVSTVLPVGVLTGLLGGPFFLWLLLHRQRRCCDAD